MLLEIIIITSIFAAGGAAALKLNWAKLETEFKGKRLAVLGARGVGKTHLLTFLTEGEISESYGKGKKYKQTLASEKKPTRRFMLRDLDLIVKETYDVSGDKAAYREWKNLCKSPMLFFICSEPTS
jgi:hypothetical protein